MRIAILQSRVIGQCTTHLPRRLASSSQTLRMAPTLKRCATGERDISPPPTKRKIPATTTSKSVSNFFKPASQKEPPKTIWSTVGDSLLRCKYDREGLPFTKPHRIAAFDLDSTLISTASGKKFSKESHDWKWWHAVVEGRLQELAKEGYVMVIFSNQAGLSIVPDPKKAASDKEKLASWKTKVNAILTAIDLPISLYAATQHDVYRKPRIGMWQQFLIDHSLTADDIDLSASFFVGDAGGRTAGANNLKKDFSCSDRNMAANIGMAFHCPEEFFLQEPVRPFARDFDPTPFLANLAAKPVEFERKHDVEIVLHVGSPSAGKSTFYWTTLEPLGYKRVNQDILKSRDKCIAVAREHIVAGDSVVVDNTNADLDVRRHWIDLARDLDVPIRCILFTASKEVCEHNNAVRALGGDSVNPESRTILPKMAFNGFVSRYKEPKLQEGFFDITKVPFIFAGTEEQKAIWSKYWL